MQERLQKLLAAAGIGSRRACETWISEGRVHVNGKVITELGTKADPAVDRVTFNGRLVTAPTHRYYIALHKPRGYVCSLADSHAAHLVTELVDLPSKPMLRPVGRLDQETEGLLLLTDDGDFLYKLTHPKHQIPKTYRANVRGVPDPEAITRLAQGVMLDDGQAAPAEHIRVRHVTREAGSPGRSEVELTIYEGRNRQVRRMMSAVGHPVTRLVRIRIGGVRLTGLPSGAWRHLTVKEIEMLTAEQPAKSREQPNTTPEENNQTWPTAQSHSRPPRARLSPSSTKRTPPSRPKTSSHLPKKGSTTA